MSDALDRLENALVLEEGSSFHLVVCPARLELDDWLLNLAARLGERRGEEVTLRRLDPYERLAQADQALSEEDMVEGVLRPLLESSGSSHGHGVIDIVDASLIHPRDEERWRWVFRRMNELRNRLMSSRNDALLLAGIPRVEFLFAAQAPDFWSIRGGEATVSPQQRQVPPGTGVDQLLLDVLGLCGWAVREQHADQLELAIEALRVGDREEARTFVEGLRAQLQAGHGAWTDDLVAMFEIFLAIEDSIRRGWERAGDELRKQVGRLLPLPSGATGTDFILAEMSGWFMLLLSEAAEQVGALSDAWQWHEDAFSRLYGRWASGVMNGLDFWLVRACLGCFRVKARQGELPEAQVWLWGAEAFVARAPWLLLTEDEDSVLPRAQDYRGLADGYRLLGHRSRTLFYEKEEQESASRIPPRRPWEHPRNWADDYLVWPGPFQLKP